MAGVTEFEMPYDVILLPGDPLIKKYFPPLDEDDDRSLPPGTYDARHLPGKHDQKTHGKGGGKVDDMSRPPIYRGAVVQATEVPLDSAKRIAAGEATIEDLQAAGVDTKNPGAFWYSGKEGFTAEDAKEHAYAEETADKGVQNVYDSQEAWGGELGTTTHFELPVVLEGRGPAGWSTEDQEAPDLMGNSYIPKGSTINIDAVHYSPDGDRWVKLDVDVETTIQQEGYEGFRTAGDGPTKG